jgi:hypothetical protein
LPPTIARAAQDVASILWPVTAIVILGMHRSGTSATTRALGLLGASLGPPANLGKFWENQVMRRPNERLLEAFGGGWECPPELPEGWVGAPEAKALVPEAKAALAEYASAPVFVWKDPRTCMTLPFWLELFEEPPVIVFIHRHPAEVAASLRTRNSLTTAHGYALWERFNGDALRNAVGLRTVALDYGALVEAPAETMQRIVDALAGWGVTLPRDPATTDMELTPKRRHHESDHGVFDDPLSTESQRALYARLPEYSGVHDSFALDRPLPEPNPISVELLGICAQLRAARQETREANTELRRLAGSRKRLLRRLLQVTLPGRTPELDGGGMHAPSSR